MGSWVGPWVPFSKLSRQQAVETCEILIEQRDKQIRRAEAAEARLAAVLALCSEYAELYEMPSLEREARNLAALRQAPSDSEGRPQDEEAAEVCCYDGLRPCEYPQCTGPQRSPETRARRPHHFHQIVDDDRCWCGNPVSHPIHAAEVDTEEDHDAR